jgi:hypothetical protein
MSFAALEQRLNLAAKARISNASATWWRGGIDMGVPVPALRLIYDREASPQFADRTVVDAQPVASVLADDAPGIARKCALRIVRDGGDMTPRLFNVLKVEPDGTGWIQLYLTEDAL